MDVGDIAFQITVELAETLNKSKHCNEFAAVSFAAATLSASAFQHAWPERTPEDWVALCVSAWGAGWKLKQQQPVESKVIQ